MVSDLSFLFSRLRLKVLFVPMVGYDSGAALKATSSTGCSTVTSEPFTRKSMCDVLVVCSQSGNRYYLRISRLTVESLYTPSSAVAIGNALNGVLI